MAIELERERLHGVLVLAPSGRLDNENAADFEIVVQEALAAGDRHVVLDLAGLDYLSNAGARALGRLAKALHTPTTSLRVAGAGEAARGVFEAAGVAAMMQLHPDRAHALATHPAVLGARLAAPLARVLGAPPPAPRVSDARRAELAELTELALDLLVGRGRQTRAVRAMAAGTQVMQAIRAQNLPPPVVRRPKPGFWQRLFGRRG